jgi:Flp pilus assembly protein TadD
LVARRFVEAEAQLRVVLELDANDPRKAHAHMLLGSALASQGKLNEGIAHLTQALALDPTLTDAHALLGEAYDGRGELALAARHFGLAVESAPDDPHILRRAAWFLATSPRDDTRDGEKALALAERARQLTGGQDTMALEALGAAYAELRRFDEATAAIRQAIALAHAQGNQAFVSALEQELALVESRSPLRLQSR